MTSTTTNSIRLLLIDDEPDLLLTVGGYLRELGYQLETAGDGAKGLEIVRNGHIDIVITDLEMPRTDGLEVLRGVQEVAPGTEVIMITGHGDMEAAAQAIRLGAHDFFTKPVALEELTASLERTSRFHALREEKAPVQVTARPP